MTKVRMNLRKVAIIVACLAVTAIFAACDKTNDDNGGGKKPNDDETNDDEKRELSVEEQKLVGTWGAQWDGSVVYRFYDNGSYILYAHYTSFNDMRARGYWTLKNGVLTCNAQWSTQTNTNIAGYFEEWGYAWTPWSDWETNVKEIVFGVVSTGSYAGKEYFEYYHYEWTAFIKDRIGSGILGM